MTRQIVAAACGLQHILLQHKTQHKMVQRLLSKRQCTSLPRSAGQQRLLLSLQFLHTRTPGCTYLCRTYLSSPGSTRTRSSSNGTSLCCDRRSSRGHLQHHAPHTPHTHPYHVFRHMLGVHTNAELMSFRLTAPSVQVRCSVLALHQHYGASITAVPRQMQGCWTLAAHCQCTTPKNRNQYKDIHAPCPHKRLCQFCISRQCSDELIHSTRAGVDGLVGLGRGSRRLHAAYHTQSNASTSNRTIRSCNNLAPDPGGSYATNSWRCPAGSADKAAQAMLAKGPRGGPEQNDSQVQGGTTSEKLTPASAMAPSTCLLVTPSTPS